MRMRTKATIGGGIIIAAMIAGAMLSDYFNFRGFGLGDGDGARAMLPLNSQQTDDSSSDDERRQVSAELPDERAARSGPPLQPGEVLNVVIDGRDYAVRQVIDGEERLHPLSLAEVVELAKAAPGNNEGIKVRVLRRESSRPTAEQALEQALLQSGIESREILQSEELLK